MGPVVAVLYAAHCDCTAGDGTLDVACVACDALDGCTSPGIRREGGERVDACLDGPSAAVAATAVVAVAGENPGDGLGVDRAAVAPGDRDVVVAAAAVAPWAIGVARSG